MTLFRNAPKHHEVAAVDVERSTRDVPWRSRTRQSRSSRRLRVPCQGGGPDSSVASRSRYVGRGALPGEFGVDHAGTDRVDGDAVLAKLLPRRRASGPSNPVFDVGVVGAAEGADHPARGGGDVDDPPVLPAPSSPAGPAWIRSKRRGEVHFDRLPPLGGRDLVRTSSSAASAGVVDQDVDAAEMIERLFDDRCGALVGGDVGCDAERTRADTARHFSGAARIPHVHGDERPAFVQTRRGGAARPRGRTRDNRHATGEVSRSDIRRHRWRSIRRSPRDTQRVLRRRRLAWGCGKCDALCSGFTCGWASSSWRPKGATVGEKRAGRTGQARRSARDPRPDDPHHPRAGAPARLRHLQRLTRSATTTSGSIQARCSRR